MASYMKSFTRIPIVDDSCESTDSECSNGVDEVKRCQSSQSRHSQDDEIGTMRRPTRRPDPKVTNRNAIMARENRRRQKERLERLEEENQLLSSKNCNLQKQLKAKDRQMRELEREYKYLKSIIANKTPIIEILNTIKKAKMPEISSSFETFMTRGKSPATESTVSASSGYASPNLNQQNDYEMDLNAFSSDIWNNMGDGIFSDIKPDIDPKKEPATLPSSVQSEHSYSDPGVCVHISKQRVSIEFCGKCNSNAADGWLEH